MTLKIQQFIHCFDNISEANTYLKQNLRIDSEHIVAWDAEGNEYNFFRYSPGHRADMVNPIVRETHGLVLYEDGGLLTKLHNHPIVIENHLQLEGQRVYEFCGVPDGRFVSVYNLEGKWRVATDATIDGREFMAVNRPGYYLEREFMETVGGQKKFETAHPDLIYVFNYVSNNNIQILPYNGKKAFLFTIIDRITGKELKYDAIIKVAESMCFDPVDNVVQTLIPGEAAVTEDERYFIPNKTYIAVKNALEAGERVSPIHMVKIHQSCRSVRDLDVVCLTFPNYERMLDLIEKVHRKWQTDLYQLWLAAQYYLDNPKTFAQLVEHHPLNFILHKLRSKESIGISSELKILKPDKVVELVREYDPNLFKTYEKLIKFERGNDLENKSASQKAGG